ncbi:beta-ketoacyl-ACP synthase III [Bacillus tianshenii]|nr:beta-ketoacyl-ACP synthase III [Bacillus tianshenii]
MLNVKITATATYLPKRVVTSEEVDVRIGEKAGWSEKKSGVRTRHFADHETASEMGALAAIKALKKANLTYEDLDCIVCASGVPQQAIPCTAALVQEQLGKQMSGTPCFDVNATCLSFVTALDMMSYAIEANRYRRICIISSEIASAGLDWENKESAALFGDGAVAVIVERASDEDSSKIIHAKMETYSKGAHFTEIRGGGTMISPRHYDKADEKDFLFDMNGRAIFRLTSTLMTDYLDRLFAPVPYSLDDIELVIPHQASQMAMGIIRKKMGVPEERFMNIISTYGNTIAASIPMALHEAIETERIKRGDRILLLGTSAGLSIGGMILEY